METGITTLNNLDNKESFIQKLNALTGMSGSKPFPKHIKFDGAEGVFKVETDDKDAEGKPVYKPIGETLRMHIVRTRKMVQSDFDSDAGLYSNEFDGGVFQVLNRDKQVVFSGTYGQLKATPMYQDIKYFEVLYIYAGTNEPQLYRLKLSGSKLSGWFNYKNQFQNDNPARFWTVATKGVQETNGAVKYYTLNFRRDAEIDRPTVIKRVMDVQEYIGAYEATKRPLQAPVAQLQPQDVPTPIYGQDPADVLPEFDEPVNNEVNQIPF